MPAASDHRTLQLDDGRTLGYAEYGAPEGTPLLALHGTPGSRRMLRVADQPARRQRIRLIAPDRPGFGLSDRQPGRELVDLAGDVAALADHLAIERFVLAGISGGGPYALACAARIPERLVRVGVISGLGPIAGLGRAAGVELRVRLAFGLARRAPWLVRRLTAWAGRRLRRAPDAAYARAVAMAPPVDQAIMTRPEVEAALISSLEDAFRAGGEGVAEELILFAGPWGFGLEAITAEVHLWHGLEDRLVPVAMGRHVAARVPHCRATFVPAVGHYWMFDQIEPLLAALAGRPR